MSRIRKRKKKSDHSGVISGIVSAGLFLFLFFGAPDLGLLAIPIAAGVFIGVNLIIAPARKRGSVEMIVSGITKEEFDQIIDEAEDKARHMLRLIDNMPKNETRTLSTQVLDVVYRIVEDLKNDPKDVKPARQFLTYYMDSTITIFQKYIDIISSGAKGSDIQSAMQKINETLAALKKAYEKQLEKLLENDLMDLDTELDLLKTTMKSQGLEDV